MAELESVAESAPANTTPSETGELIDQEDSILTPEHIKSKLIQQIENVDLVNVVDESDGCGSKFSVLVVSNTFQGKPILARHRLVNGALKEEMSVIHALTIKTMTPEQWAALSHDQS